MTTYRPQSEKRILIVVLLLAFCGIATAAILLFNAKVGYLTPIKGVHFWSLPQKAHADQLQADLKNVATYRVGPDELGLLSIIREANKSEASLEGAIEISSPAQQERVREAIAQYIKKNGPENYVRLGLVVREQVLRSIESILPDANMAEDTLVSWIRKNEKDTRVQFVREHAGNLLEWAIHSGLLARNQSHSEERRFILATLYKIRWIRWAEFTGTLDHYLSDLERSALLVFQIEFESDLSVDERLSQLERVERLVPGYPADLMRVVLHYRAGNLKLARSLLSKLAKDDPKNPAIRELKSLVGATTK